MNSLQTLLRYLPIVLMVILSGLLIREIIKQGAKVVPSKIGLESLMIIFLMMAFTKEEIAPWLDLRHDPDIRLKLGLAAFLTLCLLSSLWFIPDPRRTKHRKPRPQRKRANHKTAAPN